MAKFEVSFADRALPSSGVLAIPVYRLRQFGKFGEELDAKLGGLLRTAMSSAAFSGDVGQVLKIYAPGDLGLDCMILFGLGDPSLATPQEREEGAAAMAAAVKSTHELLTIAADLAIGAKESEAELVARLVYGTGLAAYSFEQYRTDIPSDEATKLRRAILLCSDPVGATKRHKSEAAILQGIYTARDLANEPANILTPPEFARRCAALADLGLNIQLLGSDEIERLGMGAFLAVSQGSSFDPTLAVIRWNGAPDTSQPIALIGKGLTFDSGGISAKSEPGIWAMKADMAGAAAVVGAMQALALRKAKVNVVAVLPITENMPDSRAQRPGDVVRTMSGKTVEVVNTDGEGRLVLADAMTYAVHQFNPRVMVELSTLTGGIIGAVGYEFAGLFSQNDALAEELLAASAANTDRVWRMPMGKPFEKALKSPIADIKNTPDDVRTAAASIGATFLQHFAKDVPFAHLDIASATLGDPRPPLSPTFGTGFGVRLISQWIIDRFELKVYKGR